VAVSVAVNVKLWDGVTLGVGDAVKDWVAVKLKLWVTEGVTVRVSLNVGVAVEVWVALKVND